MTEISIVSLVARRMKPANPDKRRRIPWL